MSPRLREPCQCYPHHCDRPNTGHLRRRAQEATTKRNHIRSALAGAVLSLILAGFTSGCVSPSAPRSSAPGASATGTSTSVAAPSTAQPAPTSTSSLASTSTSQTVCAIIGDFGVENRHERAVADLVASWSPRFIVTTGDNYYMKSGGTSTSAFAKSVGTYYGTWLNGAFFPALGNHDYNVTPAPRMYTDYFNLPGPGLANTSGNERYYDFTQGPVHFFVLNSNKEEPHGISGTSRQARWLKKQLAASTAKWNVVVMHHPPYSSDNEHEPSTYMRWPYASWGANVVIAGHNHIYERLHRKDIVYFVNGLGGVARYDIGAPMSGSTVRYNSNWGAQKVTITDTALVFEFYDIAGRRIDRYSVPAK